MIAIRRRQVARSQKTHWGRSSTREQIAQREIAFSLTQAVFLTQILCSDNNVTHGTGPTTRRLWCLPSSGSKSLHLPKEPEPWLPRQRAERSAVAHVRSATSETPRRHLPSGSGHKANATLQGSGCLGRQPAKRTSKTESRTARRSERHDKLHSALKAIRPCLVLSAQPGAEKVALGKMLCRVQCGNTPAFQERPQIQTRSRPIQMQPSKPATAAGGNKPS